jgi:hypothetical protein
MIEKDKSTIVVMKGSTRRQVIYNSDTKWMQGTQASNKPSSLDELKENWYVNCKGTFDGVKLLGDLWSTAAPPGTPAPVPAEARAMPADDRPGLDDNEDFSPARPEL